MLIDLLVMEMEEMGSERHGVSRGGAWGFARRCR